MTEKREAFISVDVEASGPVPPEFSLMSIGACRVDDLERDFYCELKPLNMNADPAALAVTGFSLEGLQQTGLDPVAAMEQFGGWLNGTLAPDEEPIFTGFNAGFDWSFVNYYFHRFIGRNPFGFAPLDIKSLYMGAAHCSWSDTRSSRMPIAPQAKERKHNALADAKFQAGLFLLARGRKYDASDPSRQDDSSS